MKLTNLIAYIQNDCYAKNYGLSNVSVQYRIIGSMAPSILQETGTAEKAVTVHLKPKLRSLLREQGKTIKRAVKQRSRKRHAR